MLVVKIKVKQELLSISAELAVGNEILTISGPSGCGKTTLLKSIAGLSCRMMVSSG